VAFADKWDFCDATSFWRILAAYCRALRAAAPGRFAVVQAWQMRLIHVHDEPKLDPNVSPGGELTVVQHYLERRPLAALDLHLLARSASFTRAVPPARDPRKPGPPLR
jgi:hypothetical protein